ncbi:hypothetical protein PENSPDRAFT_647453 [Peniophora sp. CONT]|nr:hypothetical protein PENSPDRAFT_647453 [Peniophora sp. CONT]
METLEVDMDASTTSTRWDDDPSSRYRRNITTVPICRLAPELLSRIFTEYAEEEGAHWNLKWTYLMLVCRRFREVGLAHIELWSYISMPLHLPSPDACASYETRIGRAKGWPLSIRLHYNTDLAYFLEHRETFFWQPANLKELIINRDRRNSRGSHFEGFLSRLVAAEYPKLQSLTLNAATMKSSYSHLIHRLLSFSVTPVLQTLSLGFVPAEVWTDLPSLTHFDLSSPLPDRDIILNLLSLLQRCPQLQALRITELQRHFRDIDLPCPSDQVLLPKLESIIHFGDLPLANALFKSITVPRAKSLMMILTSMDSVAGIKQLAANIKRYLLDSPKAAAGAHVLEVDRHTFTAYSHRDCREMTMSIGIGTLPPEIDLERLFYTLVPAFLYAAPIACIDMRYRSVEDDDTPTLSFSTDKCVVLIQPAENVWWMLDILRSLLPSLDARTHIASICVDLSMFEKHGPELARRTFSRVTEYLKEAKMAGKGLEVVEVIHTVQSKEELGLVPLDELRRLVEVGVIVDGTMHVPL